MNTVEFIGPRRSADRHQPARREATIGLQGDALIVELRSAKTTLDQRRRERPRETPEPESTPKTSPDRIAHKFPGFRDRLDHFDQSLLQEPVKPRRKDGKSRAEPVINEKLNAILRTGLQALRTQLDWLMRSGLDEVTAGGSLAEQIVRSHENQLRAAARVLIISTAVAGSWLTLVPLSGAVVLPGKLEVKSSVKKIQHPNGGVITAIPVQDGMHVSAGTLLVRLDETQVKANEQLVADQLDQVRARIAQLIGERDGLSGIQLSKQLADQINDPSVAKLVAAETALFNARLTARQGQKDLYQSNIHELEEQIDGLKAEIRAKASQIGLIATELIGVQELFAKGLVPLTRMTTLQRNSARLEGERAELTATIAATKAKIGQAQLQIAQIDEDFRSNVIKDLREAEDKEAELTERNVAASDQLNRTEIRAPTSGIVHELAVHTIGGVIRPGEVIMEIVPDTGALDIEGHLPPNEIDQVKVNQGAFLRFSTLDRQTMPAVAGTVTYVSPDLSHDEQSNASYYTIKVELPSGERRRLDGMALVSGMPVEIFLQTGSRTMLGYLLKPIADQFHRMFNEP